MAISFGGGSAAWKEKGGPEDLVNHGCGLCEQSRGTLSVTTGGCINSTRWPRMKFPALPALSPSGPGEKLSVQDRMSDSLFLPNCRPFSTKPEQPAL